MDLPRFLTSININDAPPRAPRVLLYIPPHGKPVHCPDVDSARSAAENYAAEQPGKTVGVYQLVGYAYRPIVKPSFQDSEQALAALLDAEPDSGVIGDSADDSAPDRSDLSPAQIAQLDHMRRVMAGGEHEQDGDE
jgi:hypothetical protein